jgi:predicted TPR repeat methyltransferase
MMEHSREDAYRLASPAAHREYYDAWAATYDADFIQARRYLVPAAVASAFLSRAGIHDSPVADIGCGTGQLGRALGAVDVDGFDVSPEMLAIARASGAYRDVRLADLTDPHSAVERAYGGLVSSGTFTHGHLGPVDLASVLGLCRPGALCAVGINADHFSVAGFGVLLDELIALARIADLQLADTPSYADESVEDVPVNHTVVALFRLAD